jgi:phosphate transport system substrate-binding protein
MRIAWAVLILALLSTCAPAAEHPKFNETLHAKASPNLPAYKKNGNLSGTIRSVGADTMEDLMKLWIADFRTIYPDVNFEMQAKASGTAAPALTDGSADIGPVAREILPNEATPFREKYGYEPFAIRVAGGSYRTPGKTHAIVFVVNSKNPFSKVTLAQLDAIYSKTRKRGYKEVNTWGDVGATGDFADKPIHLWGLIQPNGIAHFLDERVLENGEYKDDITQRTTVGNLPALDAIAQGVAADPYAIGYTGLTSVIDGTKALALANDGKGPYYKGTFQEVVDQKYPLSREIYIYLNRKAGDLIDPKVREFLKFILSEQGQQDVVKEGVFLPLTPQIVKEELQKVQ